MPTDLHTERLTLRPISSDDVEQVAKLAGTDDTDRVAKLAQNSADWWRAHDYGVWVIEADQNSGCIGWCGLRPEMSPDAPELFYGLDSNARGKGFATEAGLAVLNYVLVQPGISSVWAAAEYSNTSSIAVMQRLRMTFESRTDLDGVDSVIYRVTNTTGS